MGLLPGAAALLGALLSIRPCLWSPGPRPSPVCHSLFVLCSEPTLRQPGCGVGLISGDGVPGARAWGWRQVSRATGEEGRASGRPSRGCLGMGVLLPNAPARPRRLKNCRSGERAFPQGAPILPSYPRRPSSFPGISAIPCTLDVGSSLRTGFPSFNRTSSAQNRFSYFSVLGTQWVGARPFLCFIFPRSSFSIPFHSSSQTSTRVY